MKIAPVSINSLLLLLSLLDTTNGFLAPHHYGRRGDGVAAAAAPSRQQQHALFAAPKGNSDAEQEVDLEYLKAELLQYLQLRQELAADEAAAAEVGRVVGGTKGNAILEYVSGAPNKETRIETAPNALDYDQLTKYGYSHLVTPIMKAGGRLAMYKLLDMEAPDTSASLEKLYYKAPKLEIDREGRNDKARYTGLKLGQVLDDNLQAEALSAAQEKVKRGEGLRPQLQEETYILPFADKRNVSPTPMTPDWTPEKLDEWGRKQGKAQAWARRAREGEFVKDPLETTELDTTQQAFSILSGLMIATAFGKSSPTFLVQMTGLLPDNAAAESLLGAMQAPAFGLLAASLGSVVVCVLQAKEKNRDPVVWAIKGLLGGPLTVSG